MLSDDAVEDGAYLAINKPIHSGLEDIQIIFSWSGNTLADRAFVFIVVYVFWINLI